MELAIKNPLCFVLLKKNCLEVQTEPSVLKILISGTWPGDGSSGRGGKKRRAGRGKTTEGGRPERERKGPQSLQTVLSPSRVMLPTELKLNPPTQQFGNV